MKRVFILCSCFLLLASGIARAAPQAPRAVIDGRGVTTLTWQQPSAAQVCVYGEVLLFCREYQVGPQRVQLGARGPLTAHVRAGDVLTLREVGGGEVRVRVARRWDLWMPFVRR